MKLKRLQHQSYVLCHMFCGWRLYPDWDRLAELGDGVLEIDVLTGICQFNGREISRLSISVALRSWLVEDLEANQIPLQNIGSARLTVQMRAGFERRTGLLSSNRDFLLEGVVVGNGKPYKTTLEDKNGHQTIVDRRAPSMRSDQPRTTRSVLGIWTMIQGAFWIGVSIVTLPAAFRMADILHAEDFDRAGIVPRWFGPWHFATSHPNVVTLGLLALGAALVAIGVFFTIGGGGRVHRWFEWAVLFAVVCSLILAAALTPLATMGRDWPRGVPAYDVRRTVIVSTVAVWVDLVFLIATMAIVKRIPKGAA